MGRTRRPEPCQVPAMERHVHRRAGGGQGRVVGAIRRGAVVRRPLVRLPNLNDFFLQPLCLDLAPVLLVYTHRGRLSMLASCIRFRRSWYASSIACRWAACDARCVCQASSSVSYSGERAGGFPRGASSRVRAATVARRSSASSSTSTTAGGVSSRGSSSSTPSSP